MNDRTETPFERELRERFADRTARVRPSGDAWEAIADRSRRADRVRRIAVPAVVVGSLAALVLGGVATLRTTSPAPQVAGVAAEGGDVPTSDPVATASPSATAEPSPTVVEPGLCSAPRSEIVGFPRTYRPQPGDEVVDPCPRQEHGFDTTALARAVGPWDDPLYARDVASAHAEGGQDQRDSRATVEQLFDAPDRLCAWASRVVADDRGELDDPYLRLHAEVNRHLSVAADGLPLVIARACGLPAH